MKSIDRHQVIIDISRYGGYPIPDHKPLPPATIITPSMEHFIGHNPYKLPSSPEAILTPKAPDEAQKKIAEMVRDKQLY